MLGPVALGTAYASLTGLIFVLGGMLAVRFFNLPEQVADRPSRGYLAVAERGYERARGNDPDTAFFPAFPLLGRLTARWTGLSTAMSMSMVANLAFWAAMILMAARSGGGSCPSKYFTYYSTLIMGLLPCTFLCRLPGPESMLLLLTVAMLQGFERRWPPLSLAAIVGLGTGINPIGVGLIVPLFVHLKLTRENPSAHLLKIGMLTPAALWGIIGFMIYLDYSFGDPLAFARGRGVGGLLDAFHTPEKVESLLSLEPIWGTYDPRSTYHWQSMEPGRHLLSSLAFWGPAWFLSSVGLVVWGRSRRSLTAEEFATAIVLLLIAYWQAGLQPRPWALIRPCAMAVPVFSVLGRALAGLPTYVGACLAGISGFFLGIDSGLGLAGDAEL